jgi:hypothetical protein
MFLEPDKGGLIHAKESYHTPRLPMCERTSLSPVSAVSIARSFASPSELLMNAD